VTTKKKKQKENCLQLMGCAEHPPGLKNRGGFHQLGRSSINVTTGKEKMPTGLNRNSDAGLGGKNFFTSERNDG